MTQVVEKDPPGWLALDDTSACWTNTGGGTVMKVEEIRRDADHSRLGPDQAVRHRGERRGGLLDNEGGTVMTVASTGGAPTTLASGQSTPYGIALSTTRASTGPPTPRAVR
jgi:hypothetical protein